MQPIPSALRDQWLADLHGSLNPAAEKERALQAVVERYSEAHRHYHATEHVFAVLGHAHRIMLAEGVDTTSDLATTIRFALWYHDAIYDVRSGTNEYDSAELADHELAKLGIHAHVRNDVRRLIMITKYPAVPATVDEAIVHDADLAILGASPTAYLRYTHQVRAEYAYVSDTDWVRGRTAVMEAFLHAPTIFHTDSAKSAQEQARLNISEELLRLASNTPE
jgi:predicted metal-dependent HD superfamily phosphohydrolase